MAADKSPGPAKGPEPPADAPDILDVFGLDELQELQDVFAEATGVASIITRPDGSPVTRPSNFRRVCTDIVRASERGLAGCMVRAASIGPSTDDASSVERVLGGALWDAGTPIVVNGMHLANWMIGQIRTEDVDEGSMRAFAREIGVDEAEFVSALGEVPVMSEQAFRRIASFLSTTVSHMAAIASRGEDYKRVLDEHEQAARALAESEERFRLMVQEAPHPMILHAEDDEIVLVNRAWEEITGYKHEDIPTTAEWTQKAYGERAGAVMADIDALFKLQHRVDEGEYRITTRGGETRIWDFSSAPMGHTADGRRMLISIAHDVTDKERTEELLRSADRRYRMLFEGMLEGFAYCRMVFDDDGKPIDWVYLEVNDAFTRITGLSGVVGKPVSEILPTIATDSPELMQAYARVTATGHPEEFEFDFKTVGEWLRIYAFRPEPGHFVAVFEDITERKRAEQALMGTNERLERVLRSITAAMGKIVESRDPYTQGHEEHVAALCRSIAVEMGLPAEDIEMIESAALVHDIGKLSVPAEILTKPGQLSVAEFRLIREHPESGHSILKDIEFDWPLAEIVLQHHERLDGSGYPRGLAGEDISLAARILAVADVVEAMASHRPYRPALGLEAAITEIRLHPECFDPRVAAALIRLFNDGRIEL